MVSAAENGSGPSSLSSSPSTKKSQKPKPARSQSGRRITVAVAVPKTAISATATRVERYLTGSAVSSTTTPLTAARANPSNVVTTHCAASTSSR